MTTRICERTVTLRRPFPLEGFDAPLPADARRVAVARSARP